MKKLISALVAAFALVGVAHAGGADVVVKYGGPSGSGEVIWWAPSTGTTNMVMTTTGISTLTDAGSAVTISTLASNKVFIGNASGVPVAQTLSGDATITTNGTVTVAPKTITMGTAIVQTNATVGGTLGVTGASVLGNTLNVAGAATLSNNATVGGTFGATGAAVLGSTLNVAGAATLSNNISIAGTTLMSGVATFTVAPKVTVTTAVDLVTGVVATMTNLPAACTTTPQWINVTIGTATYLVPAFLKP